MAMLGETRSRRRTWYLIAAFMVTIVSWLGIEDASHKVLPTFLGKYPGEALWSLMVFFGLGLIFKQASEGLKLELCGARLLFRN